MVEPDKVRDYLLSSTHAVGRFKAVFFATSRLHGRELGRIAEGSLADRVAWRVVLERDMPEHGLRRGDLGAVVEVYEPDGLEVEEAGRC